MAMPMEKKKSNEGSKEKFSEETRYFYSRKRSLKFWIGVLEVSPLQKCLLFLCIFLEGLSSYPYAIQYILIQEGYTCTVGAFSDLTKALDDADLTYQIIETPLDIFDYL